MQFHEANLRDVCVFIEEKIHFFGDDINVPHDWDLTVNADIQELLDKHPSEIDKYKYVIKLFDLLNYIKLDTNGAMISNVTVNGYKFIFKYLHNIVFD